VSYFEEARARARRRKSRWNLLLIPAAAVPVALLWACALLAAEQVHLRFFREESLRTGEGPWIVIAAVAPLLGAIPIGMLLGNLMIHRIEGARMALDREAAPEPRLSERASNAALARAALYATVASLAAVLLRALMPW
jgi:hypothetical protein